MKQTLSLLLVAGMTALVTPSNACTGITLTARDGSRILARTIEWAGSELNSTCVLVPRGHSLQSLTPDGRGGITFTARYGFAGLSVYQEEFIAEGLNEAGLSAGLFYFPGYGTYPAYKADERAHTIADLQLVAYLLATCATVEEAKQAVLSSLRICAIDTRASTAHWRIADKSGHQVVLEVIDGHPRFYDNPLGVITNAPSFPWQLTNLNNYVNLHAGSASSQTLADALRLQPFGAGSGMLGLPGDVTPPSRFVRAAFFQATAPRQTTAHATVLQAFHLLNNFDIPIGIEAGADEPVADLPSATQWTSATDIAHGILYYRTMYNSTLRCIRLDRVDFGRMQYRALPLDSTKEEPIVEVTIND